MREKIRISTQPGQLNEGLFGQIFLHIFEVLPWLEAKDIYPEWAIRSTLYGAADDFLVIPGLLETNYEVEGGNRREVSLLDLRYREAVVLGDDWEYTARLWNKYFRWPDRVVKRADQFPSLKQALGLHYRGTDKNQSTGETNPISQQDFLTLVADFVRTHPDIQTIYIASDENDFVERVRTQHPSWQVVESGAARHHKDGIVEKDYAKGDHALLDCLLLSRCRYLVKCQSALSGFAKILNPRLEAYRVSANKPWWGWGIPYFPDAHLPKLTSTDPHCQRILARLFSGDWTDDKKTVKKFSKPFRYQKRKRYTVNMPPWWTVEGVRMRVESRIDRLIEKLGR